MPRHLLLAACLALTACGAASAPASDEASPTAGADGDAGREPEATALRDAMQAPLDKARAAEAGQAEREAERKQALEDAGG